MKRVKIIYDMITRKKVICHRFHTGFTFVEMLLVTVMIAAIGLALYMMLSNGMKVWQIVSRESCQIDVSLFFERITEELKNSFVYQDIEFKGDAHQLSFPALLKGQTRESGFSQAIGSVSYFYDQGTKTLDRRECDYQQLYSVRSEAAYQLMKDIDEFLLKYYYYHKEKEAFFWSDSWPPEELKKKKISLPLAVRIELSFKDGIYFERRIRTIGIPAGGRLE